MHQGDTFSSVRADPGHGDGEAADQYDSNHRGDDHDVVVAGLGVYAYDGVVGIQFPVVHRIPRMQQAYDTLGQNGHFLVPRE